MAKRPNAIGTMKTTKARKTKKRLAAKAEFLQGLSTGKKRCSRV